MPSYICICILVAAVIAAVAFVFVVRKCNNCQMMALRHFCLPTIVAMACNHHVHLVVLQIVGYPQRILSKCTQILQYIFVPAVFLFLEKMRKIPDRLWCELRSFNEPLGALLLETQSCSSPAKLLPKLCGCCLF